MGSEDPMDLPPGFRFHPTDEELITHYLLRKLVYQSFSPLAISEVDMNHVEPWSLPWMARIGEKEWYFFCLRDRKYPSGQRTNRATPSGYWKATGKDREIFRGNVLIGWKKTLVFYQGRAPTGEKSNWVSHEFRIEGSYGDRVISGIARKDWVIIRVYQKTAGGQRVSLSDLAGVNQVENGVGSSAMAPPINPQANPQDNHVVAMEAGQGGGGGGEGIVAGDPNQIPEDTMDYLGNPILSSNPFPGDAFVGAAQVEPVPIHGGNELGYPGLITPQEPLPFGSLTGNIEQNLDVEFVTGNYDIDMANYAPEQQAGTSFDLPNLEMDGTFGFGDDELQSILDCIWG